MRVADSGAGIGELQNQVGGLSGRSNVEGSAARFFDGVQGVFDNLHENLKQLVGISRGVRKIFADGEPHLDFSRWAARLQHVRSAGEEYTDIYGSFFSGRLLGKAEEIGD